MSSRYVPAEHVRMQAVPLLVLVLARFLCHNCTGDELIVDTAVAGTGATAVWVTLGTRLAHGELDATTAANRANKATTRCAIHTTTPFQDVTQVAASRRNRAAP